MIGAYRALAVTFYYSGDFEAARKYAMSGVQIWRSGCLQSPVERVSSHAVICPCYEALSAWHVGEIASCKATMAQAIALARELNDMPALAVALWNAAILGHLQRNPIEVEHLALDLIELSTRQNFAFWLPQGEILPGLGAERFRQHSGRHRADRGRNQGLAGNRLYADCALLPRTKG
jgi:hypothetical protein